MKDKIVFWGTNEQDVEVLVTLRLKAAENKIDIWTFPKDTLQEEFITKMFQNWDDIEVESFPQPNIYTEYQLVEDNFSILPDTIKVTEKEIITRAQNEWHVKILSLKFAKKLSDEVEQLYQQVTAMEEYDKDVWLLAKNFWSKVNEHFQARDITKEDANKLRDKINSSFDKLKILRKANNEKFEEEAKANFATIINKIETCKNNIPKSRNLNSIFDELKNIQDASKTAKLTRELRFKIREQLNIAFEAVRKERKNSKFRRLESRINGLENAIAKMEKSINRDQSSLDFQRNRIASTKGQLEAKLREAKIQMIDVKLSSKKEKLNDMNLTLNDLHTKLTNEKAKAEEEAKKKAELAAKKAEEQAKKKAEMEAKKAEEQAKKKAEMEAKKAAEEIPTTSKPEPVEIIQEGEVTKEEVVVATDTKTTTVTESIEVASSKVEEPVEALTETPTIKVES